MTTTASAAIAALDAERHAAFEADLGGARGLVLPAAYLETVIVR